MNLQRVFTPIGASFLLNFGGQLLSAQSIPLSGTITIQNSAYETGRKHYVDGAGVRAPFAKAAASDRTGAFTLHFSGLTPGSPVRITVEKPGLEVVNRAELDAAILGGAPLEVIMADAGKLAETRQRYYGIATEAISSSFHRRMAALRSESQGLAERLAAFNAERGSEVSNLVEAIEILTAEREAAERNASDLAERMATTDLDEASTLFRRAFEMLGRGQLDSTLQLVNEERLTADLASARERHVQGSGLIARADQTIRQVYQGYGLRADVQAASMDHRGMLASLDAMAAMLSTDPEAFPPETPYRLALRRGDALYVLGRYPEAVAEYEKGRDLVREHLGHDHPEQVKFLCQWTEVLQRADSLEKARRLLDEGFALMKGHEEEDPDQMATLEENLAYVIRRQGDPVAAIPHAERSLAIRKAHPELNAMGVLENMNIVAILHDELGQYDRSIAMMEEAIGRMGQDGKGMGASRGMFLSNLGQSYLRAGMLDKAGPALSTSMSWLMQDLVPDHPSVLLAHIHMAEFLSEMGEHAQALAQLDSGLVMNRGSVPEDHSIMAFLHNQRAIIHVAMKNQPAAIEALQDALEVFQRLFGELHQETATVRHNIGFVRGTTGDAEGALIDHELALRTRIELFGPEHREVVTTGCFVGRWLEELGRDSAAVATFARYLPTMKRDLGYQGTDLLSFEVRMARALYRRALLDSARTMLEGTLAVRPTQQAEWYLYRIAMDQDRSRDAMEHVVRSARLLHERSTPEQRKEVMDAMSELATRLDRKDVIEEFKLKE